ncbi:MAG: hypothetical protein KAI66_18525 [Lentisphaeria bacterium]|nr:hypothetical protein [Lentisphaeria bacterium]
MLKVGAKTAYKQLMERLERLFTLNPDLPTAELEELYELAEQAGATHVESVLALADRLLERYLESPPKRIEKELFVEYFDLLDCSARLLKEKGELVEDSPPEEGDGFSLVHQSHYSSLNWCRVLNQAGIPRELFLAVEACRRRNDLLQSVFEYVVVVTMKMDQQRALEWQLSLLDRMGEELDLDVARDILGAWLKLETNVPASLLAWAEKWSADAGLYRQWPNVSRKADRLLCQHALLHWRTAHSQRNARTAHLALLVSHGRTDDTTLLEWLETALQDVSDCVRQFMDLGNVKKEDDSERAWHSAALAREVTRIDSLFVPVLLTADQIMRVPDGAYRFALAFFGMVGEGRELWEKRLLELAENAVRRLFLGALKAGQKPAAIIRNLTFGDEEAYQALLGELDWETQNFDSLKQREKVVRRLAAFYASYRESNLLASEIARRYRNLMRLLHEDNLRRILLPEDADRVLASTVIRDLSSVASDARRFLVNRRALDREIEEMVAAEEDFVQSVRLRRLRIIHGLLA